MMSKTHEGYLLIADITGYTRYLSESELEHAQETLTALLELLVENTRPPLVISRLAGDAVISYGLRGDFFQGQTFIEKIEDIYVTFRKALERLVLNNTCRCNACANISLLDLKFFIHYGSFGIQHISITTSWSEMTSIWFTVCSRTASRRRSVFERTHSTRKQLSGC
jgi:hypothetical protein